MEQTTISIRMDKDLKKKMERLCDDLGMNLTTAFTIFAKKATREHRIPFEVSADPVRENIVTEEDLRRGAEEIAAGLGLKVTMEELEALEREPPDGPTFRELERRHAELQVKLREWRAARGYADE